MTQTRTGRERDAGLRGQSAVPSTVRALVDDFLAALDTEAPGLVEGLYLTGSVALADFQLQVSDVQFVAVLAAPPDTRRIATLQRVHQWPRTARP